MTDSSFLDSTYNAFMFVVDWPVKDEYTLTNVAFRNIKVDGTGTNVVNARVGGWATFENVDARNVGAPFINNCGTFHFTGIPEFEPRLLGTSNDGNWTAERALPGAAKTVRQWCRRHRRVPGLLLGRSEAG